MIVALEVVRPLVRVEAGARDGPEPATVVAADHDGLAFVYERGHLPDPANTAGTFADCGIEGGRDRRSENQWLTPTV